MKRFLKYAALIATVLMVCSSAWAISMAPNNKGDAMIFPYYLALDGGFATKLTVINTDQKNSAVAKIAFKTGGYSQETLDFLIYLTPADVWTGTLYYNTTTETVNIFSTDGSIVTDTTPTFASKENPVDEPLSAAKCSIDSELFGYVEVILSAIGPVPDANGIAQPGVDKKTLYSQYTVLGTEASDPEKQKLVLAAVFLGDDNVLAGYMDFGNPVLGLNTTLRATTFADYRNKAKLDVRALTIFGQYSSFGLADIEAALSKDYVGMPYVSGDSTTYQIFTFPTKITNATDCAEPTTTSPYFQQNASKTTTCITYTPKTYDLEEHSKDTPFSGKGKLAPMCTEVNVLSPVSYLEGWAYYVFGKHTTVPNPPAFPSDQTVYTSIEYTGTPVIASYFTLGASGLFGEYASWTDTLVTVDGVDNINYQYDKTSFLPFQ